MHNDNLYKGFEVELFTGSHNNHVGVSDDIEKIFSNLSKSPIKEMLNILLPQKETIKSVLITC